VSAPSPSGGGGGGAIDWLDILFVAAVLLVARRPAFRSPAMRSGDKRARRGRFRM
jgi:hypothetical protein